MKSKYYILFGAVILAFSACFNQEDSKPNITQEIKLVMKAYRTAWRTADSSAVLSHLSSDVILFQPSKAGKPVNGKSALSEFWFPSSNINYPIINYVIEHEEIGGTKEMAYYQGLSKLTWCTQENGVNRDTTTSISEFTNILRKEAGSWKIHRIMYNLKDKDYSRTPQ